MTEFAIVCKNVAHRWQQSGSLQPDLPQKPGLDLDLDLDLEVATEINVEIDTAEAPRTDDGLTAVCSCCPADVTFNLADPASLLEWCDSIRFIPDAELEAAVGPVGVPVAEPGELGLG